MDDFTIVETKNVPIDSIIKVFWWLPMVTMPHPSKIKDRNQSMLR